MKKRSHHEIFTLMINSNISPAAADLIAYFVEHQPLDNLYECLLDASGQIYWQYNDSFLICHFFESGDHLIEVANPYLKHGYTFMGLDEFIKLIDLLRANVTVMQVKILQKDVTERYDYEDSKQYW